MKSLISPSTQYDVNSVKSIVAILYLAIIGPSMFILQPAYVQGLVEYLNFSEKSSGFIASWEMIGVAIMAVAVNFALERFNWRVLTLFFVILAVVGNALSIGVDNPVLLATIRFVAGLGSGGIMVITFAMMGLTFRTERNMGFILVGVLTYGALGLFVLPNVFSNFGVDGLLIFLTVFCASGMFFLSNLPDSHKVECLGVKKICFPWSIKSITLLGVLIYNLGIGVVWVYMFLVGTSSGIAEQDVANQLTLSQFFGVGGAMISVFFEAKLGRLIPLALGIITGSIGIIMILDRPTLLMYGLGVCLFNFSWNMTMPYLLAFLASFDSKGQLVAYGTALQMLGYAIGPAIAAVVVSGGRFDVANIVAVTFFLVSAVLLMVSSYMQTKHHSVVMV